ncbi:hypothetical protein CEXT_504611 [Caerostris extrusa]|uniref:Uncharacterized protein n=1 Tax=Caerostris extrusa TaxID=172846 RepID=A0AAV4VP73_CAEEX|nr:hypothetical protein CEXT_504611 [Caerostris extrusa]
MLGLLPLIVRFGLDYSEDSPPRGVKIFRFSSALSPVTAVLKPGAYWPQKLAFSTERLLDTRNSHSQLRVHTQTSGMKRPWSSKTDNPRRVDYKCDSGFYAFHSGTCSVPLVRPGLDYSEDSPPHGLLHCPQ